MLLALEKFYEFDRSLWFKFTYNFPSFLNAIHDSRESFSAQY